MAQLQSNNGVSLEVEREVANAGNRALDGKSIHKPNDNIFNIIFLSSEAEKPGLYHATVMDTLDGQASVREVIQLAKLPLTSTDDIMDGFDIIRLASGDKLELESLLSPLDTIIVRKKAQSYEAHVILDGENLSIAELTTLADVNKKVQLAPSVQKIVKTARNFIESEIQEGKTIYGINTGFGKLANTRISGEKLQKLQENLITSHAAGVGNALSLEHTRMMFALRINVLAKGYSGISYSLLCHVVDIFNKGLLPKVPEQGTAGASGDLAPLAHIAHGLMGNGEMWSPKTGWGQASDVLAANDLTPITLGIKEGLSMINGAQFITSIGADAVNHARLLGRQADVVAALTLEALSGSTVPFSSCLHRVRAHRGQGKCAQRMRALLHSDVYPSQISLQHRHCDKVQDPYSLRCIPQVHGVVMDTVEFVAGIIETELNSATDNPTVFPDLKLILSGGNFHGEYPAKALDYLAIAVHELASISERRLEQMINPSLSNLPAFLVKDSGVNSGFMMAQVTASSLVSENKVLCHPSSIDSLPTSAGQEDHVSMGGYSARKALKVIENVEYVLAIELLAACQAIDLVRPKRTNLPLESIHRLVRHSIPPWDADRYMAADIKKSKDLLRDGKLWQLVELFIDEYIRDEDRHGST